MEKKVTKKLSRVKKKELSIQTLCYKTTCETVCLTISFPYPFHLTYLEKKKLGCVPNVYSTNTQRTILADLFIEITKSSNQTCMQSV